MDLEPTRLFHSRDITTVVILPDLKIGKIALFVGRINGLELFMNIEINCLSKTYFAGNRKALDQINMTIGTGILGLIGRNGAGKTTLMRILATVLEPSEGKILFDGKDLNAHKSEFRSSLGYLPQNTKLMPQLNIVEFLDYVSLMKGITQKEERCQKIQDIIEIVGLVGE